MFRDELETLINRHSVENGSNTPDFILAGFLNSCLDVFDHSVRERDKWYGVSLCPSNSHFEDVHKETKEGLGDSDIVQQINGVVESK
jgi:hypothetical protein